MLGVLLPSALMLTVPSGAPFGPLQTRVASSVAQTTPPPKRRSRQGGWQGSAPPSVPSAPPPSAVPAVSPAPLSLAMSVGAPSDELPISVAATSGAASTPASGTFVPKLP